MSDTPFLPTAPHETNPLITPPALPHGAPPLDIVKDEHFLPAIIWGIDKAKDEIAAIRDNPAAPTFENTIEAYEFAGADLERIKGVFYNISSANCSAALRDIKKIANVELTRLGNDLSFDAALFARVKTVYDSRDQLSLTGEQSMLLNKAYKGFVRNGALLTQEQKDRMRVIDETLSTLTTKFEDNDVAATEAYKRIITDEAELAGVPERAKNDYRAQAKEAGLADGTFLILLEPYPSDIPTHCTNRSLREEIYRAGATTGFHDEYDNTGIILDLVRLRHESAQLLGYGTYAEFVLSDRMSGSVQVVNDFLEKNLAVYKPAAEIELQELRDFAKQTDGLTELKSWDIGYYARLLKEQKFDFKTEALRPYFDLEKVMEGLRQHAEKLFNIELREEKTGKYPVYHPDVKTYEVYDRTTGDQISVFYGDYYARAGIKNGGAWMSSFRDGGLSGGKKQIPLVTNNCNFSKPTPEQPTLLSIRDVETVFHEFGHGLHGMLAKGTYPSLMGTNVKWDFVELPSQLMENWVGEAEVLAGFAHHHETGQPVPADLVQKMKDSKNFGAGMAGLRQTFLGLLDMAYYTTDPAKITSAEDLEASIGARATLIKREAGLMSTGFTHIFSGGYSAGYNSYKWAEGLDADVFAQFKQQGLYDRALGDRLRETIYSKGGTEEPMKLYVDMMGREPDPDAMFRREGLLPDRGAQGLGTSSPKMTPV